jgi:glyoxylate reductase
MPPTILVTRRLPDAALDRLRAAGRVDLNEEDRVLTRAELLQRIRGAAALVCLLTDTIDGEVLDAAGGGLKVVSNYAVGINNIDLAAATARRIPVTNTPGVLTDATADFTWALILDTVRRVTEGDRIMRRGAFPGWSPLYHLGGDVTGATLGIFGLGRIGQAVARRARGFEMKVMYHQRIRAATAVEEASGARYVDFATLLRESDILTLHAPLAPETRHRFGRAEFTAMKRSAFLINTSRGPLVRETDLVSALTERLIAGAGLDVYEDEPRMAAGLEHLETVVLAPHLGSATVATRGRMADLAVENVLAALAGRPATHCVNPEVYT